MGNSYLMFQGRQAFVRVFSVVDWLDVIRKTCLGKGFSVVD